MNKKGFTLIELLIVVTIIGILAVALVPRIVGGSASARDARRQTDLQTIATGLEYYMSENADLSDFGVAGAELAPGDLTDLSAYIGGIPTDPGDTEYQIFLLDDASGSVTKYALVATLELPAEGDDFVYGSISAEDAYSDFVDDIIADPYADGDAAGYFIVY